MSGSSVAHRNQFKERLAAGEQLIGLWMALGDGYAAEALAGCGYDWLLIDAEHGPNDLRTVLDQVRAIAAASFLHGDRAATVSQPVVRLPHGDTALIKQYLEIGVQNLLVPMVDTAPQAAELVSAVRYPPRGVRGMGSGLARSSRWGQINDYIARADENICLIVQIESREALENLEAIASTDGVDAVLFGPADLAADLGCPGRPSHEVVVEAISEGLSVLGETGTPAGIMLTDVAATKKWLEAGITFAGVGVDTSLLTRAADALLAAFRDDNTRPPASAGGGY